MVKKNHDIEILALTARQSDLFIEDFMFEAGLKDKSKIYEPLRAALHAVRDSLNVESAACLGSRLPALVRGLYYEGWNPAQSRSQVYGADIMSRIREELDGEIEPGTEYLLLSVIDLLQRMVTDCAGQKP